MARYTVGQYLCNPLSEDIHPKFVQELLGHANVSITLDTYSHMLPGMGGEPQANPRGVRVVSSEPRIISGVLLCCE
jgi:integrase